ncbi:MAG: hypothetical protein L0G39_04010 [Chryseobacterium sp.]|nr:hypothetical protein [Chryseobacterium sp.]MDN5482002.1 hypothetical protein [Chryseobacterium sp.]
MERIRKQKHRSICVTIPINIKLRLQIPVDALAGLSIPGLWLLGDKGIQIPVGISIKRLNELKA